MPDKNFSEQNSLRSAARTEKNLSERKELEQQTKFFEQLNSALSMASDVVSKNYLAGLNRLEVIPFNSKTDISRDLRIFKITEMTYEKDEFASYKFAAAFNALSSINCAVFLIIQSDGQDTSFYLGVRSNDKAHEISSIKNTLKKALIGQFPGIKINDNYLNDDIQNLISSIDTHSICAVSCVAGSKEGENKLNSAFVQGLEKFALSMQGEKYTAVILANSNPSEHIIKLRNDYETIYSNLSMFASKQISNSVNNSISFSEALSQSETHGTSSSTGSSITTSHSTSKTEGTNEGTSEKSAAGKGLLVGGAALGAAAAFFPPITPVAIAVGALSGLTATKTTGTNSSKSESDSVSQSTQESHAINDSESKSQTRTAANQSGTSQSVTFTQTDKKISGLLERIDTQLKRVKEFESLGMWECAAYFMAEDVHTAEMAALSYKALMSGANSGVETSAINSWNESSRDELVKARTAKVAKYIKNFVHPVFKYGSGIPVTPSAFVSGNELALHMGLPRHSVRGLPVIEHAKFELEIIRYDNKKPDHSLYLGNSFNMGSETAGCVNLDRGSLTMHTFITGSTGSGKSSTVYGMLEQLKKAKINFMVIEPAKGEYKNILGIYDDVLVLGTNPNYSKLLKINPFKFPKGVHVLEHIDRLLDVFNVCWPMYAAMPAVLKSAVSNAYETCGWDLLTSQNRFNEKFFPTFADLLFELSQVISTSAYSQETKGDYIGALSTRISSLTNGINGQIFCADEIDNQTLFDGSVIIDLSRVGSIETKSLIMGLLLIRLHEYRSSNSGVMNAALKHVTVLEEAHHLLKRTSTEQNFEGANLAGKSVEMLANSIAEMRTWGEGFIIADQSPNALDPSAIRNTNTKIIMRLPDEADRRLAGKSASLKDEQLEELAKLPGGVAAVYQNDWAAPVLCKIRKFETSAKKFEYVPDLSEQFNERMIKNALMKFLLKSRIPDNAEPDLEIIERGLKKLPVHTKLKLALLQNVQQYKRDGKIALWDEERFSELAKVVTDLICGKERLEKIIKPDSSAHEVQELLFHEIDRYAPEMPSALQFAVCQCLMKNYSRTDGERLNLYSEWREYAIKRGAEIK
ncbi:MAG: ATP-binding protein [Synergistaceae bacterium]|nr:ATP-binding protein [Synergistaceae bacterium]